ncbi:lipoyl(octanoyl) transferase LipB [Ichthyobacterium seriolicida]|uniref:Octanoyltransferase n=1 Tax=Ichthyobacterium seriolicida TaxID=242600 RepID=A0A1J1E6C2_9FLAO|nr:lipoyl(octanoyl) transferase LipB [Ichthyobacterium seriolicida]BAV94870.1 octanoyltransferase [Ichthyobacterium seriolicida]
MNNRKVILEDLGYLEYQKALEIQKNIFDEILNQKLSNRKLPEDKQIITQNHLLFVEHPHVYTIGKTGNMDNLLLRENLLEREGITLYKTDRGGDITYHGPGQIVGYPILNLDYFFTDLHKYLRFLEEVIIKAISHYGLSGHRSKDGTGVWLDVDKPSTRKICAIGIRSSRWTVMHGFALNANTDLDFFRHIFPCGIRDRQVTSLEKELGYKVDTEELKKNIISNAFAEVFKAEIIRK